jgi:ABC-type transport system involved in multi-copper enzyme maturation permease subunit
MISATRVGAVAGNTLREAIRNRVLYTLLAFALLLIGSSILLANLSYVEQGRILQDIALGSMRLFGVALAIAVGINLIHREVERRTIYTILAKPISRGEFLLGKYLGLVATIWMLVAIMSVVFVAVSLADGTPVGLGHAAALLLLGMELAVVVGVATLFSAFTTPTLSALFTTALWVAGNLTRDLEQLAQQTRVDEIIGVARVLHQVLPDLAAFNLSLKATHGLPIAAAAEVGLPLAYGAAWCAFLLLVAIAIFRRRDLR